MKKLTAIVSVIMAALLVMMFGTTVSAKSTYNLKAPKKTSSSVTLTWDEQPGADAYTVYLYDSASGMYKEYKTVLNEKCTIDGLDASSPYKIKVKAVAKVKGKYKTISKSGAVTVKTAGTAKQKQPARTAPKGDSSSTTTADISELIKWDYVWGNGRYLSMSMAEEGIKSYLDKFANAGYAVDSYNYGTRTNHKYFISYNGVTIGTAHADVYSNYSIHVYFRKTSPTDARREVPTESATTPVSTLITWNYTWADYGNENMCDNGIKKYLDKFTNAGYTVENYNNGTSTHQLYNIYYGSQIVGTVYADKSTYFNSNVGAYNWMVHLYFKKV